VLIQSFVHRLSRVDCATTVSLLATPYSRPALSQRT
jgi:hypothetical protein